MHRVELARLAERGLRSISEGDPRGYARVARGIRSLSEDPYPPGAVRLQSFDPPAWRIRVGEYRIVYEVYRSRLLVIVINIAPRGEVYR